MNIFKIIDQFVKNILFLQPNEVGFALLGFYGQKVTTRPSLSTPVGKFYTKKI